MQDTNATTVEAGNNTGALVGLTASIVSSFVGGGSNHIGAAELPALIQSVHASLIGLGGQSQTEQTKQEPAISVRKSVQPDFIVCLEDGKKLKMLKRYLATRFNMTPDQYRAKWGLNADYPMVAPNYAETRRKLAVDIGLGRKRTRTADASGASSTARGGRGKSATGTTGTGRGRRATGAATSKAAQAKGGRNSGGRSKAS